MNEELKDVLIRYKECTLEITKVIEEDKFDFLEELIQKRQQLVEDALSCIHEQEEDKKIYKELDLDELQSRLNSLMQRKLEGIRNEMQKISKSKMANNVYNKGNYRTAAIFSKKI